MACETICRFFTFFYVFVFKIQKNMTFYVFFECCTRFPQQCLAQQALALTPCLPYLDGWWGTRGIDVAAPVAWSHLAFRSPSAVQRSTSPVCDKCPLDGSTSTGLPLDKRTCRSCDQTEDYWALWLVGNSNGHVRRNRFLLRNTTEVKKKQYRIKQKSV